VQKLYYSQRRGQRPITVNLVQLKRIVGGLYRDWESAGLFQEWFGFECVDDGSVNGRAGSDSAAFAFRLTLNEKVWPVDLNLESWSESDLFDALEFLHDHISVGSAGRYHRYGDCGHHFAEFDPQAGRTRMRTALNPMLGRYGSGFELNPEGQIVDLLRPEVMDLVRAAIPPQVSEVVANHLAVAIRLFRARSSGIEDRRNAVRELADALEYLHPQLRACLASADDAMLFELANKFHIRHSNPSQVRGYDASGLRWMFEFYLSTLFYAFGLLGWSTAVSADQDPPIPDEPPIPDRSFDPDEIPF
jgi:hypothetical protein